MYSRGVQILRCICTRIVYGGASKVKRKRDVFSGDRVFRCRLPCSSAQRERERERERERDLRCCVRFALGFFFPFFLCACLPASVLHQNVKRHDVSCCCCCSGEEGDKNKSSSTSFFFFFFCSVSSFLFLVFFLFRSRLLCVVDCEQQYASAVVVCAACLEWVPDVLSSLSSQCKGCISNEDRNLGGGFCDVQ
jgi:hypothetical protein